MAKAAAAAYEDASDSEWHDVDKDDSFDDYDEEEGYDSERRYYVSYAVGPNFLPDSCVLLDNQSNTHLFRNKDLLT